MCMSVQVPAKARRGHQIPWSWRYRWLSHLIEALETELWTSAEAVCAFNCRAISPACTEFTHTYIFQLVFLFGSSWEEYNSPRF